MSRALAKELVPGKVRFTSGPGRARRQKLLEAARELLAERQPNEISYADVCERAQIPRPSAYHFFPSIQAIFVGLRLLQAGELVEAITNIDAEEFETWPQYFRQIVDKGAMALSADPAGTKLIYGILDGYSEVRQLGQDVDARLAEAAMQVFAARFQIPEWEERDRTFAIAFTIVDSVFKLSFRREGEISAVMIEEAKRAAISYLRNYLPEFLPRRTRA